MASQSQTTRVAMLNTDTPVPNVRAKQKTYGKIFHRLLSHAASRISSSSSKNNTTTINLRIESTDFDVVLGEYPASLSDFDALLITGSAASAYDDAAWIHRLDDFIVDVYRNHPDVKIFGSCFGHQLVCQSLLGRFGVIVEKNPEGWEIGVHEMEIKEEFRKVFGYQCSDATTTTTCAREPTPPDGIDEDGGGYASQSIVPPKLRLQFVHADHVRIPSPELLPQSWVVMASTPRCKVQGVYEPGRVLTYQGHFEFDRFVNSETIKVFGASWEPEVLQKSLDSTDAEDDAELAAEIVVRFFAEGRTGPVDAGAQVVGDVVTPPADD